MVAAAALLAAIMALAAAFAGIVRWFDKHKKRDSDIKELRNTHESDMAHMKEEQTLMVYGLLACLKGLKEQGCNGPVTEAIDKIEKHLNKRAHE